MPDPRPLAAGIGFRAIMACDLADGTRTITDIARQMNVSTVTVRGHLKKCRDAGLNPVVKRSETLDGDRRSAAASQRLQSIETMAFVGRFITGGGIVQMVNRLPLEIAHWLIEQIPPGGTLTDLLVAIIVDTYAEETGVAQ